ncbi:toll/interleukin-1 receptor domain-containing protein [Kribbella sp. NPDC055110]
MDPTAYTIIVQSESVAVGNQQCYGLAASALVQPVRLRVVSDAPSDTDRALLVNAIVAELGSLAPAGFGGCDGPGKLGCWATEEESVRNLLLVVGGGAPPTAELEHLVDRWQQRGFEALGVFQEDADPDVVLPTGLTHQHAPSWEVDVREVAADLVDVVALGAEERRIFISYSHCDGTASAERVALLLTARRFDVFLDRFRLQPGVDFVERIEDELIDKAMVVVIETPAAVQSSWVKHEVATAVTRRLGLVAIPDGPDKFGAVDPRTRKQAILSDEELGGFLIEQHRAQLRAKRDNLLDSVWQSLRQTAIAAKDIRSVAAGFRVTALGHDYRIAVHPRPADLHRFRLAHESAGAGAKPVVVHPSPIRASRRRDLGWLGTATGIAEVDEGEMDRAAAEIAKGGLR